MSSNDDTKVLVGLVRSLIGILVGYYGMNLLIAILALFVPRPLPTPPTSSRCASAEGDRYKVTMYSGGHPVGSWHTRDGFRRTSSDNSYDFVDSVSGRCVWVSGDVVLEKE